MIYRWSELADRCSVAGVSRDVLSFWDGNPGKLDPSRGVGSSGSGVFLEKEAVSGDHGSQKAILAETLTLLLGMKNSK